MKFNSVLTDNAVLQEIGERMAQLRLSRNLTQGSLAELAGMSKRTIERLERGEAGVRLTAFVRASRALGLIERMESFLPPPAPAPIAQMKLQGRMRRRASGRRKPLAAPKPWRWGDES